MYRAEIRKINSTTFARHFGSEIKFVTEDKGHLWLHFRGKPRAVVIPMRDEAVLNDVQGRDFEDLVHKANVRHARMVRAAYRQKKYRSEIIEDSANEIPFHRLTDEEWAQFSQRQFMKYGPVG